MRSTRFLYKFTAVALLLMFGMVLGASAYDILDPTTTWNVKPIELEFNQTNRACPAGSELIKDQFQSAAPGFDSETYNIDGISVTIEITVYADNSFDFKVINGVMPQMFVKGSNYLLYQYDPPVAGATNTGPVSMDTGLHDGVNNQNPPTSYQMISHLDFCIIPLRPLTAVKDAFGTYTKDITWELDKSVKEEAYAGLPGDTFVPIWTVVATKTVEETWVVEGDITINNPNGFAVPFAVEDKLSDGTIAIVICPDTSVPANDSIVCTYTAETDNKAASNTATVTSPVVDGDVANATVIWSDVVNGDEEVTVDDDRDDEGNFPALISNSTTFDYDETLACSTKQEDYDENGVDEDTYPNVATLKGPNNDLSDDAEVVVTCYAPVVEKTVTPAWEEDYQWSLVKNVDNTTFSGNPGDGWTFNYYIDLTLDSYDQLNFSAGGEVIVFNPSPWDMTVGLTDVVSNAANYPGIILADGDCDFDGTDLTIPAGTTSDCFYSVDMGDDLDGEQATVFTNTATATLGGGSFIDTKTFTFGDVDPSQAAGSEGPEVNVTDDDATPGDPVDDHTSGPIATTIEGTIQDVITYSQGGTCPTDITMYTDGVYTITLTNTAVIDETTDFDIEMVTVTCYAPLVSKNVTPAWQEDYQWDLFKNVDNTTFSGNPGDGWVFNYDIDLQLTSYDQLNFSASGVITVINTDPDDPMVVGLTDVISNGADYPGVITADADCDFDGTNLTIPAGETATCPYTVDMGDDQDANKDVIYTNTATATIGGASVDGTASFTFNDVAPTLAEGSEPAEVNVTDDNATPGDTGDDHSAGPFSGSTSDVITYSQGGTCPTDITEYTSGVYEITLTNTADIVETDDSDEETVTVDCEAGTVDLIKLTNGQPTTSQTWTFEIYEGPDGFGGTPIASDSTPPAYLDFGGPALSTAQTYTICEIGVPAGYSVLWVIDDGDGVLTGADTIVNPYNPNADDDPPEDLGNRCVDFTVSMGQTLSYIVDNQQPGGAPRTPGYWKNWNTCTGGGQVGTAGANGGWMEGFWLLDDVLVPSIGGGIVWDDILTDEFVFTIDTCEVAVDILDKREVGDPSVIKDGKKKASDPLHNLATHLLAAQLNFGAGACTTQDVLDAALAAEELLDFYDFDGNSHTLAKNDKDGKALANALATYLDDYNNGAFCGS